MVGFLASRWHIFRLLVTHWHHPSGYEPSDWSERFDRVHLRVYTAWSTISSYAVSLPTASVYRGTYD